MRKERARAMEVKLSKVDKAARKDMQGYLEISDRIAKGEEVSASELAFAVEVRKADNEKMKGQLALDTKYYVCDRSGVSTLLKETEFDKIAIKCRKANGEEVTVGLEEFYQGFDKGEYSNVGINAIVTSRVILQLWDEASGYTEKSDKEEYVVKATYKFAEVTCVYKNEFVEKIER